LKESLQQSVGDNPQDLPENTIHALKNIVAQAEKMHKKSQIQPSLSHLKEVWNDHQ